MSDASELHASVLELNRAIDRLSVSIEQLVRKDVYESDQRGVDRRIVGLEAGLSTLDKSVEKIEERRAADRRLIFTGFVLPLGLLLIQIWIAAQTGAPPS